MARARIEANVMNRIAMKPNLQRTYTPKASEIEREWLIVDATDVPLGRLASQVAHVLRGKHKPTFAPHMDGGDHVIVINAEKVAATGSKETQKMYYRHSGYPGGLREMNLAEMRTKFPDRIIENAVKGMLPKNKLGRQMASKLKVYAGPDHPHAAQQPSPMVLPDRKDNRKVEA